VGDDITIQNRLSQLNDVRWRNDEVLNKAVVTKLQELPPAGDAALISALNLAPTSNMSQQQLLDLVDGLATLFDRLNQISPLTEEQEAVLMKLIQLMKRSAFESRLAALQSAQQELNTQADLTRQQAQDMRSGAVLSLVLGSVAAASTIIMSGVAAGFAGKAAGKLHDAAKKSKEVEKATKDLNRWQRIKERMNDTGKANVNGKWGVKKGTTAFANYKDKVNRNIDHYQRKQMKLQTESQEFSGDAQEANSTAQNLSMAGQVVGQGLNTGAQGGSGLTGAAAKEKEAQAQAAAARANYWQSQAELGKKFEDDLVTILKTILEWANRVIAQQTEQMAVLNRA
jgi:hypothetical protein